ncbi:hypothetical protein TNCV_149251 [Trichonephila clavipes]|nr:hypothetical protein TNCV_149251 [Trichonephila clavipes]
MRLAGGAYRPLFLSDINRILSGVALVQQRVCLQEIVFMHDGAPPHNASSVQQLLRQELTDVRVNCRSFQLDLHYHPISRLWTSDFGTF